MANVRIFQKGNNVQLNDDATGTIIALIPSRSFRFEPQEQYAGFVIRDWEARERVRQYLYSEALDEAGAPIGGEAAVIDYLAPLVGFNPAGGGGENNTASNQGAGDGLVLPKVGVDLPFKSLVAGTNIILTPGADIITIAAAGSVGEANTQTNQGAGQGTLALPKVGVDLPIKTILAGTNITVTNNADTVEIASTDTGEANTASSAGGTESLVLAKVGVDLPFKGLTAGTSIQLTPGVNDITIATDAIPGSEKGTPNGVATLDGAGLVPSAQMPPIAISETFVVASQAAQLALVAQVGDVAVRTDESKSYILQTAPASIFTNWVELLSPGAPVQSVNTQTGNVVLDTDDISEGATNLYYTEARVDANASVAANTAKVTNANHTGDATGSGVLTIAANAVTNAKAADMPANTVKVNPTGAAGDPQDLALAPSTFLARLATGDIVAATGAEATALLNVFTSTLKGLVPASGGIATTFLNGAGAFTTPPDNGITELTGDVTAGPGNGSQAATIANNAVTNVKLADMATQTIKGRVSAGTGDPEDLTTTQLTTLVNTFTTALKGAVPAPLAVTGAVLSDNGTWVPLPAGGEANTSSNLGTGEGIAAPKVGVDLPFKSLKAAGSVGLSSDANEITITGNGEANTSSNVGTGAGLLAKAKVGVDLPFKSVKAGTNVTVNNNTDDVTINVPDIGEDNTNSNVGTGTGTLVKTKVGVDTPIKTLKAGTGITLDNNADDVTINAGGGGGGGYWCSHLGGNNVSRSVDKDLTNVVQREFVFMGTGSGKTITNVTGLADKDQLSFIGYSIFDITNGNLICSATTTAVGVTIFSLGAVSNLPVGEARFQIRASTGSGTGQATGQMYSVTINT